jgi:adenylylsulfate reductase subunit A
VPDDYKIKARNGKVYKQMTTVEGLFTAGDGVGGSGHKFSSGSHAEGRIAAKQMVRYAKDFADFTPTLKQSKEELVDLVYKPVRTFLDQLRVQHAMSISTPTTSNPKA